MPHHPYLPHELGVGPDRGQAEPHHHRVPPGLAAPVPRLLTVPPQAVHHVAPQGSPPEKCRPKVSQELGLLSVTVLINSIFITIIWAHY